MSGEVEFVDVLPADARKIAHRTPGGDYSALRAALLAQPGRWARCPDMTPTFGGPMRRSKVWWGFEGVQRNGVLYLRYVGDAA